MSWIEVSFPMMVTPPFVVRTMWASTDPTEASILRGIEQAERGEGRYLTDEDLSP